MKDSPTNHRRFQIQCRAANGHLMEVINGKRCCFLRRNQGQELRFTSTFSRSNKTSITDKPKRLLLCPTLENHSLFPTHASRDLLMSFRIISLSLSLFSVICTNATSTQVVHHIRSGIIGIESQRETCKLVANCSKKNHLASNDSR